MVPLRRQWRVLSIYLRRCRIRRDALSDGTYLHGYVQAQVAGDNKALTIRQERAEKDRLLALPGFFCPVAYVFAVLPDHLDEHCYQEHNQRLFCITSRRK